MCLVINNKFILFNKKDYLSKKDIKCCCTSLWNFLQRAVRIARGLHMQESKSFVTVFLKQTNVFYSWELSSY